MAGRQPNSLTWALTLTWCLPVLFLAVCSRFTQNNGPSVPPSNSRPLAIDTDKLSSVAAPSSPPSKPKRSEPPLHVNLPSFLRSKPASYQEIVAAIGKKRLDWTAETVKPTSDFVQGGRLLSGKSNLDAGAAQHQKPSGSNHVSHKPKDLASASPNPKSNLNNDDNSRKPRSMSTDPARQTHLKDIAVRRKRHEEDPEDLLKAVALADSLRLYDVQYHDGGTVQEEAISMYLKASTLASAQRNEAVARGDDPRKSATPIGSINDEVFLDYSARSHDGLLCAIQCGLGKTYFMANMFEKSNAAYTECLSIAPEYLDARSSRGSTRIILGDYEGAASDFESVIEQDRMHRFLDAFTGLARVLQAKESASLKGWQPMIEVVQNIIAMLQDKLHSADDSSLRTAISASLNRLYHVLFLYHDVKTSDTDKAWNALTKSYEYKAQTIEPWNPGFEKRKVDTTKAIFRQGFWPDGLGSTSTTPIFIIGFVRSGSTMLERVLDSHPDIVGTGENSVFNGRLDSIRNAIVETSMKGDSAELARVIQRLADEVVDEMRSRWEMVSASSAGDGDDDGQRTRQAQPKRFVDKMLTNYYNVGFIHMLFPNALILHVAREPMDTLLSAYKHEFPPGALDYTSFFESLSEMYVAYRDLIDHWDRELPGRITHVRYEDMVNDLPTVAKGVINRTGLDWDDGVLEFHKKKHTVNTLSTTQVRKGVYKDSIQAWKRYEKELQPLAELVGNRRSYSQLKTSLPGF